MRNIMELVDNVISMKEVREKKIELSKRVFHIIQSKKYPSGKSEDFREVFIVVDKNITLNDLYNEDVENFLDDYFPDEGEIWFKVEEYEERLKRMTESSRKQCLSHPRSHRFTIVDKTDVFIKLGKELKNSKYLPEDIGFYHDHCFIVNVSVEEDGTILMVKDKEEELKKVS
jgi:hypothetical protein